ncbi:MAG: hypothetical protein H7Y02_13835 [Candidatus Obscuribacterales bacterium]|nr:hypothetical protein [Steroidobacteraceae bacterium]
MNDLTGELRWILLACSVVLILAIYIAGRRGRGQAIAAEHASSESLDDFTDLSSDRHLSVPHLSDVVQPRARYAEPRVTFLGDDSSIDDDFPGVHIEAEVTEHSLTTSRADTDQTFTRVLSNEARIDPYVSSTEDVAESPTLAASPMQRPTQAKKVSQRKIIALRLTAGAQRFEGARLKALLEAQQCRHGKYSIYHREDEQGLTLFSVASMVEPGTFDLFTMKDTQFPGITVFAQLPGPMDGAAMFDQMLDCARNLESALSGVLQDERGTVLTPQRAERLREDIIDFQHLLSADLSGHAPATTTDLTTQPL